MIVHFLDYVTVTNTTLSFLLKVHTLTTDLRYRTNYASYSNEEEVTSGRQESNLRFEIKIKPVKTKFVIYKFQRLQLFLPFDIITEPFQIFDVSMNKL